MQNNRKSSLHPPLTFLPRFLQRVKDLILAEPIQWKGRYGKANEHTAWIPRDHWLTPTEQAVVRADALTLPKHSAKPFRKTL
jgi:hypothetical protein